MQPLRVRPHKSMVYIPQLNYGKTNLFYIYVNELQSLKPILLKEYISKLERALDQAKTVSPPSELLSAFPGPDLVIKIKELFLLKHFRSETLQSAIEKSVAEYLISSKMSHLDTKKMLERVFCLTTPKIEYDFSLVENRLKYLFSKEVEMRSQLHRSQLNLSTSAKVVEVPNSPLFSPEALEEFCRKNPTKAAAHYYKGFYSLPLGFSTIQSVKSYVESQCCSEDLLELASSFNFPLSANQIEHNKQGYMLIDKQLSPKIISFYLADYLRIGEIKDIITLFNNIDYANNRYRSCFIYTADQNAQRVPWTKITRPRGISFQFELFTPYELLENFFLEYRNLTYAAREEKEKQALELLRKCSSGHFGYNVNDFFDVNNLAKNPLLKGVLNALEEDSLKKDLKPGPTFDKLAQQAEKFFQSNPKLKHAALTAYILSQKPEHLFHIFTIAKTLSQAYDRIHSPLQESISTNFPNEVSNHVERVSTSSVSISDHSQNVSMITIPEFPSGNIDLSLIYESCFETLTRQCLFNREILETIKMSLSKSENIAPPEEIMKVVFGPNRAALVNEIFFLYYYRRHTLQSAIEHLAIEYLQNGNFFEKQSEVLQILSSHPAPNPLTNFSNPRNQLIYLVAMAKRNDQFSIGLKNTSTPQKRLELPSPLFTTGRLEEYLHKNPEKAPIILKNYYTKQYSLSSSSRTNLSEHAQKIEARIPAEYLKKIKTHFLDIERKGVPIELVHAIVDLDVPLPDLLLYSFADRNKSLDEIFATSAALEAFSSEIALLKQILPNLPIANLTRIKSNKFEYELFTPNQLLSFCYSNYCEASYSEREKKDAMALEILERFHHGEFSFSLEEIKMTQARIRNLRPELGIFVREDQPLFDASFHVRYKNFLDKNPEIRPVALAASLFSANKEFQKFPVRLTMEILKIRQENQHHDKASTHLIKRKAAEPQKKKKKQQKTGMNILQLVNRPWESGLKQ